MIVLICLFVIGAHSTMTYDQYVKYYKKNYTAAQYAIHQTEYEYKTHHIKGLKANTTTADFAVNNFTDWTDADLAAFTNTKFDEHKDGQQVKHDPLKLGAPPSMDWRTQKLVSSIKNQGSCGSCWAFTTVAMAETFLLNSSGIEYDLAEQQVLQCTASGSCSGGTIDSGYAHVITRGGIPLQTTYPYQQTKNAYFNGICANNDLIKVNVLSQHYYSYISDDDLRELLSYSPVGVAMKVQKAFYFYNGGVYNCNTTAFSQLNHAVQLIGYDIDGNWIIKNHWSTDWGEKGFARISSINNCGIGMAVYTMFEFMMTSLMILAFMVV